MRRFNLLVSLFLILPLSVFARHKKNDNPIFDALKEKGQELFIPAPQNEEVCFSPDEPCDVKFWKFLQSAESSADIAIYDITHPKIAHEIIELFHRRVKVRVVVDRRQSQERHSLVSVLVRAGVPVRFGFQRGIMHNKFTLIDEKKVETGSFNYTNHATFQNNENQVYLFDPKIAARYQERFSKLWEQGTPVTEQELTRKEKARGG